MIVDFFSQIPLVAYEVCLHKEYTALADITETFPDRGSEVNTWKIDQWGHDNKDQKIGISVASSSRVYLRPAKPECSN